MKVALYPGSFDPITNGHLDIIERAAAIFDTVLVTVFTNPLKKPLFPVEERVQMIRESTRHIPNVVVDSSSGLVSDYARENKVRVIVRGLRAVSDFENEFQMALMNKKLDPQLETMFMMASSQYSYLRASIVKELSHFGGCIKGLVPPNVEEKLRERFAAGGTSHGRN